MLEDYPVIRAIEAVMRRTRARSQAFVSQVNDWRMTNAFASIS